MLATILACWFCVHQELRVHWSPGGLTSTERGIRLRVHEQSDPYRIADLLYDGRTWRHVMPADWKEAKQRPSARALERKRCLAAIPYPPLTQEQAVTLRPHLRVGHSAEEAPRACVAAEGKLWFGLGFYEGEGMDGVGGIGFYDPAAKKLEVRRPLWLRDKSVASIAHDGHFLWLAVNQEYEGTGRGHGLARYDWTRDELEPMRGLDAPCGVSAGDVLADRGSLWVSGDLVSRRDLATGRWTHYALSADGGRLVETSCRQWYARVLDAAARAWQNGCQEVCNGDQAAEEIARADPEFARTWLLGRKELHFTETMALGGLLRTFDELKAALPKAADDEARRHLLLRFAETGNRDPRWRDFALEEMRRTGRDLAVLRRFRGDGKVFAFLSALAVEGSGWDRQNAIEILPWIDAERAKAVLRTLLRTGTANPAPGNDDMDAVANAIEALERASHLRLEADGRRTALAANSDTPDYADEEFGAFSRSRRDWADLRKIAALWLAE